MYSFDFFPGVINRLAVFLRHNHLLFKLNFAHIYVNKKVLLRERKRHTARRVASTPYVVLTGYPPSQGTPPGQGTPPARVPPLARVPLFRVPPLARVPPRPGYPPSWTWQGTPPPAGPGRVPPPPQLDLAGYPPWLPHGILGNVAKHYGIWVPLPLWTDRWMDRHVSKHYLPVVLRTRAVMRNFPLQTTHLT